MFGYEFHYARPDGPFQSAMDFFQSDQCPRRATGGWLIGGDLPRAYYTQPDRIALVFRSPLSGTAEAVLDDRWDDSSAREEAVAAGLSDPTFLPEG